LKSKISLGNIIVVIGMSGFLSLVIFGMIDKKLKELVSDSHKICDVEMNST
jgi:hypothetical protein